MPHIAESNLEAKINIKAMATVNQIYLIQLDSEVASVNAVVIRNATDALATDFLLQNHTLFDNHKRVELLLRQMIT